MRKRKSQGHRCCAHPLLIVTISTFWISPIYKGAKQKVRIFTVIWLFPGSSKIEFLLNSHLEKGNPLGVIKRDIRYQEFTDKQKEWFDDAFENHSSNPKKNTQNGTPETTPPWKRINETKITDEITTFNFILITSPFSLPCEKYGIYLDSSL